MPAADPKVVVPMVRDMALAGMAALVLPMAAGAAS
jgi:hypothetical protein